MTNDDVILKQGRVGKKEIYHLRLFIDYRVHDRFELVTPRWAYKQMRMLMSTKSSLHCIVCICSPRNAGGSYYFILFGGWIFTEPIYEGTSNISWHCITWKKCIDFKKYLDQNKHLLTPSVWTYSYISMIFLHKSVFFYE